MGKRKELTNADLLEIADRALDMANDMEAMAKALGGHAPESSVSDSEISNLLLLSIRASELALKFQMVHRINEQEREFERRMAERKAQSVTA